MTPFKLKFNVGFEVMIQQSDIVYNTMQGIQQHNPNPSDAIKLIASNNTLIKYVKETYIGRRILKENSEIILLPQINIKPNRLFVVVYTIIYNCINILPDHTYVVYEPGVGEILYIKESETTEAIVVEA